MFKRQIAAHSPVPSGAVVDVCFPDGRFLGRGYYNSASNITVRLLTLEPVAIDRAFFARRIQEAFKKREDFFTHTDAVRIIFSESDGLPGLIADRYGNTIVFQALTLGIEAWKEDIVAGLCELPGVTYVYERSEGSGRIEEGLKPVKRWWGEPGSETIDIKENGVAFCVDIVNGHKTGFYLDQRATRRALRQFCRGKRVLDLFSYVGGFGINAALAGAKEVCCVDIKQDWLDRAGHNAAMNGVATIKFIKSDVFAFLRESYRRNGRFDVIVLDPPSFLKSRHAFPGARRGYNELNLMAMKLAVEGGVLATFSCSYNLRPEAFSDILKQAAHDAGRSFTILKRCRQDKDHPIVAAIPTSDYLKGYFLKIA